jgi:hypothetical protein
MASPPKLAISFAISAPRRLSSDNTRSPAKFILDSALSMANMMPQSTGYFHAGVK